MSVRYVYASSRWRFGPRFRFQVVQRRSISRNFDNWKFWQTSRFPQDPRSGRNRKRTPRWHCPSICLPNTPSTIFIRSTFISTEYRSRGEVSAVTFPVLNIDRTKESCKFRHVFRKSCQDVRNGRLVPLLPKHWISEVIIILLFI